MPQLPSLEQTVRTRRLTCRDNFREGILVALVPIAGQRTESLELSHGLHPHANAGAMLRTPSPDRKGDVGAHELQQRGCAQRELELPGQEQHHRHEGRVLLPIMNLGQALHSPDDA